MEVVETFLKSQYGEIESKTKQAVSSKPTATDVRDFDLLLARKPPLASPQPLTSNDSMNTSFAPATDNSASKITGADRVAGNSQRPADKMIIDQIGGVRHWVKGGSSEAAQFSPTGLANSAARSRRTLYPNENEDEPGNNYGASQSHVPEDEEELRDINVSNPWTFAKLNAPIRPQKPTVSGADSVSRNQQLLTPAKQHGSLGDDLFSPDIPSASIADPNFPTPARSQNGTLHEASSPETFPYPMKRWGKVRRETDSRKESSPDEEYSSPTRLDVWVQRPPPHSEIASQEPSEGQDVLLPPRPQRDFLPASELPLGTPLNAIPDISQAPRRKAVPRKQQHQTSSKVVNKPFKPPAVHDPARVWFDHLDNPSTRPSNPNKNRIDNSLPARAPNRITSNDVSEHDPIIDDEVTPTRQQQHHHPGLAQTMDYESRKAAAIAQRRALLRQQSSSQTLAHQSNLNPPSSQATQIKISPSQQSPSSIPFSSPHQNRYNSAIAALHTPSHTNMTPNPKAALSLLADAATASPHVVAVSEGLEKIDPKDPRAYLMRFQKSSDGRVKRIRTGLLPLETPSSTMGDEGDGVRDLTQTVGTGTLLSRLRPSSSSERGQSSPIRSAQKDGNVGAFENVNVEEARTWEEIITNLICKRHPEGIGDIVGGINLVAIFTGEHTRSAENP